MSLGKSPYSTSGGLPPLGGRGIGVASRGLNARVRPNPTSSATPQWGSRTCCRRLPPLGGSGLHIEQIVAANQLARPIPIGPEPQIAYFTGQRDIVQADTALGQVRVRHNPRWDMGGPHGVRIDNIISVTLEPPSSITFDEATTRTLRLLRFLALIIGRPQTRV